MADHVIAARSERAVRISFAGTDASDPNCRVICALGWRGARRSWIAAGAIRKPRPAVSQTSVPELGGSISVDLGQLGSELIALGGGDIVGRATARLLLLRLNTRSRSPSFAVAQPLQTRTLTLIECLAISDIKAFK